MNAQDLKNSILQLAIQGKLVEQREEEGTAKGLLEQIELEKEQLIKEGKIKKQKNLLEIKEGDAPFDIPETWEWVRFGHMVNFIMGKTPQRSEPKYWGNDYNWVSIADMVSDGYVDETKEKVSEVALKEKFKLSLVPKGTLLMSFKLTVGKVSILNIDAVHNEAIISIYPYGDSENTIRNYLFTFLPLISTYGETKGAIKGKTLNSTSLNNLLIPIPPLEEQKRIVAKVEELKPYVEKYDKSYSEVEDLNKKFPEDMQKSIFQYAIQGKLVEQSEEDGTAEELYQQIQEEMKKLIKEGKAKKPKNLPIITEEDIQFDIPKSWKWVSIGQVCSNIMYGTSKKSSKEGKIAVLRMGNLQGGIIDYSNLVYSTDDEDIKKYKLEKNDLLFNRTNSRELVGKTAIYKCELPAIYAGYLVRFTPILVSSDYINFVMQSDYYWRYCQSVRSDAIGQSNINAEKLKRFVFPLPPLEEQKRIVAKIEELLPYTKQLVK